MLNRAVRIQQQLSITKALHMHAVQVVLEH
jgi:hypothetical protein